ncbi:pyrimidine utilization protein D [Erwinia tasmaniensis]|uniref:pyrimidine utilization protein D n=1 Tax=Erwinia tasmaniensis TaxID=338565 RepID=UPI003A4D8C48
MHIELIGPAHAGVRTLVLSAGLGGLASFWHPQIAALSRDYQVAVYDQRGTGRSADTLPEGYSIKDMAAELAQALAEKGLERYEVIGHALGGAIAMQMALDFPERVRGLVIVNGWLRLDAHTRRCFNVRQTLLLRAGVESFVQAQPLFLYPADWLSENQARIEAEDALHAAHFQGRDNFLHRLHALMACDFTTQAQAIAQPALLICSQDDLLVPWTCSQKLERALPHASVIKMPWGGHAMSVTASDEFNLLLLNWLQERSTHDVNA